MNSLQIRLLRFSVCVYENIQAVKNDPLLGNIANQLLRSGTSTGANYSEAQSASSSRDFHNKIRIALKEMKEAQFWIRFLKEANVEIPNLNNLLQESEELIRILSTICKKTDPKTKTTI